MNGQNGIILLERGKGLRLRNRSSSVENVDRCASLSQNLSAAFNSSVDNAPFRRV